ncbi:MAG TPA: F0F1 ATP synthase subunit B [Candidatus Saccharimonadales bacterium]|nr:F0F1 ATP synthase subunit B [Candidatus Saccharimonadales bacterium]
MINVITQFAAESAESGVLGLNVQEFVVQLITFALAILVLQRFAVKPILKILNERRETIESGVTLGEKMRQDQSKADENVAKLLQKARKEADGIIASAHDSAREVAAAIEAKAQDKANAILAEAEDRIKQDAVRARRKLESEVVGLISDATEAIIDEKVDTKKDAALIDRALKGRA